MTLSTTGRTLIYVGLLVILIVGCAPAAVDQPVAQNERREPTDSPAATYSLLIIDSQAGGHYQEIGRARQNYLETYGYSYGDNLRVSHFAVDNNLQRAEDILAAELENDYDVISVNGTIPTIAAKNVAFDEPAYQFVFASVTDPVGVGVIEDFESLPKHNFTGSSYPVPVASRLRFIKRLMPQAKTIGLVYSDIPQSHSYRAWLETLLQDDPQFSDLKIIYRLVPHITGEDGSYQMAETARRFIQEIDSQVDLFMAPNDNMGAHPHYAEVVYEIATKPLVGLSAEQVLAGHGATMAIYPSHISMGQQSGRMIRSILEGKSIQEIRPEWPQNNGIAFDLSKINEFNIQVPVDMIEMAGDNIVK